MSKVCTIFINKRLDGGCDIYSHKKHILSPGLNGLKVMLRPLEILVLLQLRLMEGVARTVLIKELNRLADLLLPLHSNLFLIVIKARMKYEPIS